MIFVLYKINNYKLLELENINFIYSIDEDTTYYFHDKVFIIARIKWYNLTTDCLYCHVFKKKPLDYLNIFIKADESIYNANNNMILYVTFNYNK